MNKEKNLIKAIQESFKRYKKFGPRSTQKIMPIHKFMADTLKDIWGNDYEICFLGENSKEAKIAGKYYDKNIDITVMKNDTPIYCLGVKFITSNYKQNANNYFENMMGETANIQANKIPYSHFIIMRYETPYYKKNDKKPIKIEKIAEKDITKYLKLLFDVPQAHRPNEICIFLINIDEQTNKITKTNLNSKFNPSFSNLMLEKLSIDNFFNQILNYKNYLELNK